jgi:hypothetical protein
MNTLRLCAPLHVQRWNSWTSVNQTIQVFCSMLFTVPFYLRIFIENYTRLWFKKSAKQVNLSLFMNNILWNEKMRVENRTNNRVFESAQIISTCLRGGYMRGAAGRQHRVYSCVHTVCSVLTINVPVVYMARYVMVLRGATSLRGALEGVGPEMATSEASAIWAQKSLCIPPPVSTK